YKFTAKELDKETGLYYYGARYLDPKYSRWISTDPALGEYIPKVGGDNSKLPSGGLFNTASFNLFNYSNNNPVKYVDPDGENPVIAIAVYTGYKMLPKQDGSGFLYFDNTQPQRTGGYHNFYETFTSNNIVCNIDSLRTDFTNSKGKTSTVWLWKGNYNMVFNGGWHIGAEVGAYGSHGGADDNMLESVSFTLTDKATGKSVDRTVTGEYWTNRFDKGKCIPSNLLLSATLTFKNEKDAKAYCNAVDNSNRYFNSKDRGKDSGKVNAICSGKTVTVTFE
ncbi:MAG: RHS repeat-associated core domain-containing protein, partial [Treponemataceae bacterium]|nr:RHS repeat-associated core domain-containing protein [Treponemataceae bacterium]